MKGLFQSEKAYEVCRKYASKNYCSWDWFCENLEVILSKGEKIAKVEDETLISNYGCAYRLDEII